MEETIEGQPLMSTKPSRAKKGAAARPRSGGSAAPAESAGPAATDTGQATPPPLFYKDPAILRHPDHAGLCLRTGQGFDFARNAAALPLTSAEFAAAGRHYPIVFSDIVDPMPLAVVGVEPEANLFLTAEGRWAGGAYVPAYVRRYPFIAVAPAPGATPVLGFDRASPLIGAGSDADGSAPLFEADGTPTTHAQEAMNFCQAYADDHVTTRAFGAALAEAGLLRQQSINLRFGNGTTGSVEGFWQIDEQAYRDLPAEKVLAFHAKGWLDLIVLHLASQFAWQGLAERRSLQLQAA